MGHSSRGCTEDFLLNTFVRVRTPLWARLSEKKKKKKTVEIYTLSDFRQIDLYCSQAYPGHAEICPGFPPPNRAHVIAAPGRETLCRMRQQWRVVSKGRNNLNDVNKGHILR